jgi:hypothetical protein
MLRKEVRGIREWAAACSFAAIFSVRIGSRGPAEPKRTCSAVDCIGRVGSWPGTWTGDHRLAFLEALPSTQSLFCMIFKRRLIHDNMQDGDEKIIIRSDPSLALSNSLIYTKHLPIFDRNDPLRVSPRSSRSRPPRWRSNSPGPV